MGRGRAGSCSGRGRANFSMIREGAINTLKPIQFKKENLQNTKGIFLSFFVDEFFHYFKAKGCIAEVMPVP